jgi:hypothetical protein
MESPTRKEIGKLQVQGRINRSELMDVEPTSSRTRPSEARASSKSGALLIVLTESPESERHDVQCDLMLMGSFVRSRPQTENLSESRER